MNLEYNTYLAHHGVKGMRWGISIMAGKNVAKNVASKDARNESSSKKKPESSTWKAKDAGNLSDEELRKRLTRLQQEKQYKEMTASRATRARKWVAKTAGKILVATAIGVLATSARTKYTSMAQEVGMLPMSATQPQYKNSFSAPHTSKG